MKVNLSALFVSSSLEIISFALSSETPRRLASDLIIRSLRSFSSFSIAYYSYSLYKSSIQMHIFFDLKFNFDLIVQYMALVLRQL